jgi:hypothetical protein
MSRVGQSGAEWSGEALGVACERGTGAGSKGVLVGEGLEVAMGRRPALLSSTR